MPSKRLSNKSFERDASRLRVLMNNDFGGAAAVQTNFIPVRSGYDYDAGAPVFVGQTVFSVTPAIGLDSSTDIVGAGVGITNIAGDVTVTPLAMINGGTAAQTVRLSANCYITPSGTAGLSGQSDSDSVAQTTVTVPTFSGNYTFWEITEMNMSVTVSANSVIQVYTRRDGGGAGDSYTGYLELVGWRVS